MSNRIIFRAFTSFTSSLHHSSSRPLVVNFKPLSIPILTRQLSISFSKMAEWKLKGLTDLNLKNLDKVEAEVEGIEKGKVLLVKLDDKVHALNPNCTHFGAPLKNGVVTPDGRITCPWHGACFNVKSGDVEDAPAPDHLHKFDVFEKEGAVYIKAQEADVKAGRRKPQVKTSSSGEERVVIVGGGSGAFGAVQKLREHIFGGHVTMITNEGLPIDRTKLSKALITDPSKLYLRDQAWYDDASITVQQDTVTGVDFVSKTVSTESGKSFPYTKLILASGGTPKKLPLPGFKDLGNIFVLRQISDVQNIMKAVGDKNKKIVIVGSSFIGMEVANALAKDNQVSVVGMEDTPLERIMGSQVGAVFQKSLEKNGAKFYMGASVDSAYPASKVANAVGLSSVGGVKLKDGTDLPADLVILGIGVGPATEYLKGNSSVTLEKDGSLAVDASFSVKGLTDVFAIGDIASYPYSGPGADKHPVRIEHWNVAQNMGRSVGYKIATGQEAKPFIPIFWSALGAQLRYCGHTPEGFDEVVIKGQTDEGKFAAYYCKGDDVVAVATMGMDPVMVKCAELMRRSEMLSKGDIQGGKDVLQVGI